MTVQRPLRSLSLARASALSQTGGGQDWHLAHKFIIFQLVILPHFYFQCGVVLFDILCVCVCVCVCVQVRMLARGGSNILRVCSRTNGGDRFTMPRICADWLNDLAMHRSATKPCLLSVFGEHLAPVH